MASNLLLDLPLEIRQIIYSYCFVPPYKQDLLKQDASLDPGSGEDVVIVHEQPAAHQQQCRHASAHLSVIQINQQIREEAYQYFAVCHTLNFPDPLKFANEYLCYMPSHCLQSIKSLHLTWQIPQKCSSYLPPRRSGVKAIDVKSQLYKVMQIFETYPELLTSIDRVSFTLPFLCNYSHTHCSDMYLQMRADLMRLSVMLCEKINGLLQSSTPVLEERFFLIEIAWPHDWHTTLWRVPKQVFDQINDQDVIQKGDCSICAQAIMSAGIGFTSHHEHDGTFADVDEIMQAVRDGRRWDPPLSRQYDLSVDKKWKAIFHPLGPRRSWNINLRYLEARRDGSLSMKQTRKRKRSKSGTSSTL